MQDPVLGARVRRPELGVTLNLIIRPIRRWCSTKPCLGAAQGLCPQQPRLRRLDPLHPRRRDEPGHLVAGTLTQILAEVLGGCGPDPADPAGARRCCSARLPPRSRCSRVRRPSARGAGTGLLMARRKLARRLTDPVSAPAARFAASKVPDAQAAHESAFDAQHDIARGHQLCAAFGRMARGRAVSFLRGIHDRQSDSSACSSRFRRR